MQIKKNPHEVLAIVLLAIIVVAQLFFMLYVPPHLDELYYIDWTNYLDLGYIEHPPLLSYIIFIFKALFGKSIFALRFISFLAFLSTLFMFYFLFKEVVYASSQVTAFLLFYSTTLVTENLFYAFSLWSLYFYQKAYTKNQLKDFLLGGTLLGLATLTNLIGLLFLAGLCFVWMFYRKIIKTRYLIFSFLLLFFILSPYLYWVSNHFYDLLGHLKNLTGGSVRISRLKDFILMELLLNPLVITMGVYLFISQLKVFLKKKGRFSEEKLLEAQTFFFLLTTPLFFYYAYKISVSKIEFYWVAPLLLLLNLLLTFFFREKKIYKSILSIILFYAGVVFIVFYGLITKVDKGFADSGLAWNYYGMGQFSDPDFKRFYEEKMDKNIPFVSHRYQVPAIINYYLEPKVPARTLTTKVYHRSIYSFNYKDSETIRLGMYYVDEGYSSDLKTIFSFYSNVEEVVYPQSLKHKKNSDLWGFPKIYKMTGFLAEKDKEMLEFVRNNGGL